MENLAFPKIKRSIQDFIDDEEASIPASKLITIGSMIVVLSTLFAIDVSARHSSHTSHTSHSSTSYHRSHVSHTSSRDGYYSHSNHSSHSNSHSSHSSSYSSYSNSTGTSQNNTPKVTKPDPDLIPKMPTVNQIKVNEKYFEDIVNPQIEENSAISLPTPLPTPDFTYNSFPSLQTPLPPHKIEK